MSSTRTLYETISQQTNDPIIERKTCTKSGDEFAIFQWDRDFLDKISPTFAGQKFVIPNPTLQPYERQRRRLAQRNERNYYKSTCSLTGKAIVTSVDPRLWEPVYDGQVRWGDQRDAMDYGQEYDESLTFFEQFHRLRKRVPKIALMNDNGVGSTNCEYTYDASYNKDVYMSAETVNWEYCFYCTNMSNSKYMIDCIMTYNSLYCVECIDSYKLYSCTYVQNSNDCNNLLFCADCKWCNDCIGCVWLRNKQYYYFNKNYSKEEYEELKKQFQQQLINNKVDTLEQRDRFNKTQPRIATNIINSQWSIWNNLFNCSQCIACFDLDDCKDCKYYATGVWARDCMDIDISIAKWWCYEWVTPDESWKTCFTTFCWKCDDVWYSEMCHRCKNCFWCVGLKDKEYCIFNVQYPDKESYETKVAEIISNMEQTWEWWEYFPHEISTYPYNLSDAMSRYPLTREQALAKWYSWSDELSTVNIPDNAVTIQWSELEVNPNLIEDSIINKVIVCAESGRPFRIMAKELEIYRKLSRPLPRVHHDVRHQRRAARRLWRDLQVRPCDETGELLIWPYASDYSGTVLSTTAYEDLL